MDDLQRDTHHVISTVWCLWNSTRWNSTVVSAVEFHTVEFHAVEFHGCVGCGIPHGGIPQRGIPQFCVGLLGKHDKKLFQIYNLAAKKTAFFGTIVIKESFNRKYFSLKNYSTKNSSRYGKHELILFNTE